MISVSVKGDESPPLRPVPAEVIDELGDASYRDCDFLVLDCGARCSALQVLGKPQTDRVVIFFYFARETLNDFTAK